MSEFRASTSLKPFSTSCYVMPVFKSENLDGQVRVFGNSVQSLSYETNQKTDFTYDQIFNNQHEFAKSAYNFSLAPLVKQAIKGESTMIIFGGVQSMKINHFLLSQTVMQGLINQAASQLLGSVNSMDEKNGTVNFSWYKIECNQQETIVDVLKAASTHGAQNKTENGLLLREAGRNRGMIVPGLWEVEIANGGDIESVVSHVVKVIPSIADHSQGNSHTIMQLTVFDKSKVNPSLSPTSSQLDPPGLGRITFVLLSNLAQADQQYLKPTSPLPVKESSGSYPWVDHLNAVLNWIESRRPSPPFHKSRISLLLKEVLLRRQQASLMLLIQPSADQHVVNMNWMNLFSNIKSESIVKSSSLPTAPLYSLSKKELSPPANQPTTPPNSKLISKNSNASVPNQLTNALYEESMDQSPVPRILPEQFSSIPTTTRKYSSSATNPGIISTTPSNLSNTNHFSTNQPTRRSSFSTHSITPRFSSHHNDVASLRSGLDDLTVGNYEEEYSIAMTENETLRTALEAKCSEVDALMISVKYAEDKYSELKISYDKLINQLKEEGGSLEKRDKERFKNALKDLRDYEIYKEVMEAAMVRLQNELEIYAKENWALKNSKSQEDRNLQKQRSSSEKYSKDLMSTKKKLNDIEIKFSQIEKQNKMLQRERDAAVASLAQNQSEKTMKLSQLQETSALKQREFEDLQKKYKVIEDKCKQLEAEKSGILANSEIELSNLRVAHSKALDTLMSYQEENDVLRSAVMELSHNNSKENSVENSREPSVLHQQVKEIITNAKSRSRQSSIQSAVSI